MNQKDWSGTKKSIFINMATNSHSINDRQNEDFYATDPIAIDKLFSKFTPNKCIWECAAGLGHLSNKIKTYSSKFNLLDVHASELIERPNPIDNIEFGVNFLLQKSKNLKYDIITNPPYKYAAEFIYKALEIVNNGQYVCMFLPLRYLEGKKRFILFNQHRLYKLLVMVNRIECAPNGKFTNNGSAQAYGWFIWKKGYNGESSIEWVQ